MVKFCGLLGEAHSFPAALIIQVMKMKRQQTLINAEELNSMRANRNIVILDLGDRASFLQGHIPGARYVSYADIVCAEPPVEGLLPTASSFSVTLSRLGINAQSAVVAYDNVGGTNAARFLWTLELAKHNEMALLDGGIAAWKAQNLPLEKTSEPWVPSGYTVRFTATVSANSAYILSALDDVNVVLLDVRTRAEYEGKDVRGRHGGHIPRAVHFEWLDGIDSEKNLCMRQKPELLAKLSQRGVTPDKEVIVYCHSHRRSAFTYYMLRVLGFENVKGYPGAWSDWGNRKDTPKELVN